MTEDEAHMTQCCGPEGCGQFNDQPYAARWCTASRCMAWRVTTIHGHQENHRKAEKPEGDGWQAQRAKVGGPPIAWWRQTPDRIVGFCGLAGAPE